VLKSVRDEVRHRFELSAFLLSGFGLVKEHPILVYLVLGSVVELQVYKKVVFFYVVLEHSLAVIRGLLVYEFLAQLPHHPPIKLSGCLRVCVLDVSDALILDLTNIATLRTDDVIFPTLIENILLHPEYMALSILQRCHVLELHQLALTDEENSSIFGLFSDYPIACLHLNYFDQAKDSLLVSPVSPLEEVPHLLVFEKEISHFFDLSD
jgi:hypothetical protein